MKTLNIRVEDGTIQDMWYTTTGDIVVVYDYDKDGPDVDDSDRKCKISFWLPGILKRAKEERINNE